MRYSGVQQVYRALISAGGRYHREGSVAGWKLNKMDVSLRPVDSLRAVVGLEGQLRRSPKVAGEGFEEAMAQALRSTSALQAEAGRLSRELTLDNPTVGLEETMIAGAKASMAFMSVTQVRNRVVQAYSEVMNMQI